MEKAVQLHSPPPTSEMSLAVAAGVSPPPVRPSLHDEKRWFIAIVMPNTEKSCCKKLADMMFSLSMSPLEFETYVPFQTEYHIWRNGRRKKIERILFPTYIFIRCTEPVRKALKCRAGFIRSFMKDRAGHPDAYGFSPFASIPDSQMLSLQRMVGDAETPITIDPRRLRVGSKVRVCWGRLAGFEGNVFREPGGRTSVVLNIDFLGWPRLRFR